MNRIILTAIGVSSTLAIAALAWAGCASPPVCECDAAITKIALQEPTAGGQALYGLLVNYNGHPLCEGGDLCVEDNLPAGLTCDANDPAYAPNSSVNPGWSCACTGGTAVRCCLSGALPASSTNLPVIHVPVLVSPDVPKVVANCASIAQGFQGSFEDNNDANNTSCVKSEVVKSKVDLAIEKSHDKPLAFDGPGVFHLAVSNQGDAAATGFTVTDMLPPGFTYTGTSSPGWTCSAAPPAPGVGQSQTVTCTYAGTLSPMTSTTLDLQVQLAGAKSFDGGTGKNCATVSAQGDVNPDNDSDCDPYCIDYSTESLSGNPDDFAVGADPESPSPSPSLVKWVTANYGIPGIRDYDDVSSNKYFGTTFENLAPPAGYTICGAKVTLQVRCNDSNDALSLRFTDPAGFDPAQIWVHFFNAAPLNADCVSGAPKTITLDLANLPASLPPGMAAPTSLLPGLNAHGFLDVVAQDDTGVDYVDLELNYCCE